MQQGRRPLGNLALPVGRHMLFMVDGRFTYRLGRCSTLGPRSVFGCPTVAASQGRTELAGTRLRSSAIPGVEASCGAWPHALRGAPCVIHGVSQAGPLRNFAAAVQAAASYALARAPLASGQMAGSPSG